MNKKKIIIVFFLSLVLLVIYFVNFYKKKLISKSETPKIENIENIESSNLLSELNFSSKSNISSSEVLFLSSSTKAWLEESLNKFPIFKLNVINNLCPY